MGRVGPGERAWADVDRVMTVAGRGHSPHPASPWGNPPIPRAGHSLQTKQLQRGSQRSARQAAANPFIPSDDTLEPGRDGNLGTPQSNLGAGRDIRAGALRAAGGSSSVNGMVYRDIQVD